MLNSQLITIARHDGHQISTDAFQLLKQEFTKRDLDISHIELAAVNKAQIKQEEIQKFKDMLLMNLREPSGNSPLMKKKMAVPIVRSWRA
ncbi:MAG: hypothetical protein IPP72_02550 [Chitinophagaceae bacterium]|nr:hypothetical protein [Chitinophagaceae bacterium]